MADRDLRHRASEADRLLREPLLIEAMNALLASARDGLETVDPTNTADVLRLQAAAAACRNLESELRGLILANPVTTPTVNNEPGVI